MFVVVDMGVSLAASTRDVGCIFGELLRGGPLMPGSTELDQLEKIFKLLGAPTEDVWPGFRDLPKVAALPIDLRKYRHSTLLDEFRTLSAAVCAVPCSVTCCCSHCLLMLLLDAAA